MAAFPGIPQLVGSLTQYAKTCQSGYRPEYIGGELKCVDVRTPQQGTFQRWLQDNPNAILIGGGALLLLVFVLGKKR